MSEFSDFSWWSFGAGMLASVVIAFVVAFWDMTRNADREF